MRTRSYGEMGAGRATLAASRLGGWFVPDFFGCRQHWRPTAGWAQLRSARRICASAARWPSHAAACDQSERHLENHRQEKERQRESNENVVTTEPATGCHNHRSYNGEFECHSFLHTNKGAARCLTITNIIAAPGRTSAQVLSERARVGRMYLAPVTSSRPRLHNGGCGGPSTRRQAGPPRRSWPNATRALRSATGCRGFRC